MVSRSFTLLLAALLFAAAPASADPKPKPGEAKRIRFGDGKLEAGKADAGVAFMGNKGNWNILLTSATKEATVYAVKVCNVASIKLVRTETKGDLADSNKGGEKSCVDVEFRTGKGIDGLRAFVKGGPKATPTVRITILKDGKPVGADFLKGAKHQKDGTFALMGKGSGAKAAGSEEKGTSK
jgi:hypothetical protein